MGQDPTTGEFRESAGNSGRPGVLPENRYPSDHRGRIGRGGRRRDLGSGGPGFEPHAGSDSRVRSFAHRVYPGGRIFRHRRKIIQAPDGDFNPSRRPRPIPHQSVITIKQDSLVVKPRTPHFPPRPAAASSSSSDGASTATKNSYPAASLGGNATTRSAISDAPYSQLPEEGVHVSTLYTLAPMDRSATPGRRERAHRQSATLSFKRLAAHPA